MSDIKLADVLIEGSDDISLVKLIGSPIKDIEGYLTSEYGSVIFKMSKVVFENGTKLFCEGEHDMPYLSAYGKDENNFMNKIETLYKEENGED